MRLPRLPLSISRRPWWRRLTLTLTAALLLAFAMVAAPPSRHALESHVPFLNHTRLVYVPLAPTRSTSEVAINSTPDGNGYWVTRADGGVYTYGDAPFWGSTTNPSSFIRGMAVASDGSGYWMTGADGAVYTTPNVPYKGGANTITHNGTIVGIAALPGKIGYWQVGSDGGVYTWPASGGPAFYGSAAPAQWPVVGMAATFDGGGYWLVADNGYVWAFGDAQKYGDASNITLNQPVVELVPTPSGHGYWLVAADGGVFTYGDAVSYRSLGGGGLSNIVGLAPTRSGRGYWFLGQDGTAYMGGDAGTMQ